MRTCTPLCAMLGEKGVKKEMETVKTPILLDVENKQLQQTIAVKQYDTARVLHITLTDAGKPYTIASDCYAVFTALKPDNEVILNNCVIENNTVIYAFTAQTTVTAGIMPCEIKLYGADNKLITSPKFFMRVEEAVYKGTTEDKVVSSSEYNALTKLIERVNTVASRVFVTETETGSAGSDASVVRSYDEDSNTVTYKFTIPRGEKGERGDKGDKGDKGEQGEKGEAFEYSDFTPEQLAALKGPQGEPGTSCTHEWNGTVLSVASASGTSSADLKGEKGDKGDTGAPGTPGTDGVSIVSISPNGQDAQGGNIYTIGLSDGSTYNIVAPKGENGVSVETLKGMFVEKVSGKDLSANDFTDALKEKLDGLSNYSLPAASETVLGGVSLSEEKYGLKADANGKLSLSGYIPPIIISQNTDIDSLMDPGDYVCPTYADSVTMTNTPVQTAFSLKVIQPGGGNDYNYRRQILQTFVPDFEIWVRTKRPAWTPWVKLGTMQSFARKPYITTTNVAVTENISGKSATNSYQGAAPTAEGYTAQRIGGYANGDILGCTPNGWIFNYTDTTKMLVTSITWLWLMLPS